MVSAIDGCSLGALCVPETWFDKAQVEIRQRRAERKARGLGPAIPWTTSSHPMRLLGEAEIAALYGDRRYEERKAEMTGVRYSSPEVGGAKYIAVCGPAFSPDTVDRDGE